MSSICQDIDKETTSGPENLQKTVSTDYQSNITKDYQDDDKKQEETLVKAGDDQTALVVPDIAKSSATRPQPVDTKKKETKRPSEKADPSKLSDMLSDKEKRALILCIIAS